MLGDDAEDPTMDPTKNAFFQDEVPSELFQGGAVNYMPSSKQDFLEKQREQDKREILSALDEEKAKLIEPTQNNDNVSQNNKRNVSVIFSFEFGIRLFLEVGYFQHYTHYFGTLISYG